MKIKKVAIIAIIIVALCVVVAATVVLVYNSMPQNVARDAFMGTLVGALQREEIKPVFDVLDGGSIELELSNLKRDDIEIYNNLSACGKVYFGKNSLAISDLKLSADKYSVFANLYVSDDFLYISESDFFDGAYGVKRGALARDFENSIFAYGSGSLFEMQDREQSDRFLKMLKAYDSVDYDEVKDRGGKIAYEYFLKLWDVVCDNADFKSHYDTVKLDGKKHSVRVITVTVNSEDVDNIIDEYYEFLCEDKSLASYLDQYEEYFNPVLSYWNPDFMDGHDKVSSAYKSFLEDFEGFLTDVRDNIQNSFDDKITLEIATPVTSSDMLKLSVKYDNRNVLYLDFGGEKINNAEKIKVKSKASNIEIIYEIVENNDHRYKCNARFNGDKIFEFDWDKSDEEYSVELNEKYYIKGNMRQGSDEYEVTLDEISVEGFYVNEELADIEEDASYTITVDSKVKIKCDDKIPNPPESYSKISDITEEKIILWKKKIRSIIFSK